MLNANPSSDTQPSRGSLRSLIADKGLKRYGVFFSTDEGVDMPNGEEESTGYVIDAHGIAYFYAIGWSLEQSSPAFLVWQKTRIEPRWVESSEYRRARKAAGLKP